MSKRVVNIGSAPNDGTGDSLRNGMDKINQNFTEIYNTFGDGTSLEGISVGDATTLDGEDGSYYLDYNNFSNVPIDLSEFNNSVGFVTASIVDGYVTEATLTGYALSSYVDSQLNLKADLSGANFTGFVTATKFYGDGSNISGIIAEGTGVVVNNNDSLVGTAATLNFADNINVVFSSGIATISSTASSQYWSQSEVGINTLSNVGIGTTNAESKLTVSGDVKITGVTTITGNYFYVGNVDTTSSGTSGVILDTSGKITNQSVGNETHIVGYAGSSLSYALSKDGNLYLGGGNPDDGGTGGNISILGQTSRIGIGSTLPQVSLDIDGDLILSGIITASAVGLTNIPSSQLTGSLPAIDGSSLLNLVAISTTAPLSPTNSKLWWKSDEGVLKIYYVDDDSSQWVDASPSGGGTSTQWVTTVSGIHTLSNVGIGTTVASSKLTVRGGDISVGVSTAHGVVLTSPNGTQFRLIVDDSGNLSTVSI